MQTTITEQVPSIPLFTTDSEFEFLEPKRVVVSPFELCLLSDAEDLFGDE